MPDPESPSSPGPVFRAVLPVPTVQIDPSVPGAAQGREPRRRRGRVSVAVGLASLLTGCGLLGYTGWQVVGTNWVAQRAQQEVVADLETAWLEAPATTLEAEFAAGEGFALVRIPRFGADYQVPLISGVSDRDLSHGLGHFPGSAGPGEVGNFAVAGHRVTHGEPLRQMPALRVGDRVLVETRGQVFTYEITSNPNDLVVDFSQTWVLDAIPSNPDPGGVEPTVTPGTALLTLVTCAEIFHTDTRMVAFGRLVATTQK